MLVFGPPFAGEDFDFAVAGEAGGGDPLIDLRQRDAALAHETAVEEEVVLVGLEVADVVGIEPAALGAALDLSFEVEFVPDVIDIKGDTDIGQGEGGAEVVGIAQGADGGAVASINGVQGFDEEFDARVAGSGSDAGDAFRDLSAVGLRGLADGGTADQDDFVNAERFGLADRGEVGGDGLVSCFGGEPGKKAAAHERHRFESGIGEVLAGGFEVNTGERFPPNGDAADAFAGVVLDALGEAPRFVGEGVNGEVGMHRRLLGQF